MVAVKNTVNVNREEETIDLLEISKFILRKIWIIIICLVVGFSGGFLYSSLAIAKTYEATSMLYVYTKTTSVTSLADLQIGSALTVDFDIIAQTREVVDAVNAELGTSIDYEDMCKKIDIETPQNSRIIQIKVTDTDPVRAAAIANSMASQLRLRIADIMDTDPPSIVSKAIVPNKKAGPSNLKNGMLAGLGLAFLAGAIIVISYLLDDTIKTEADVEKYLGQHVLAVMPMISAYDSKKKK